MKSFDYRDLDAHLLETLIATFEENSVSKAAERLNVSQSTLSHRLERLRQIFADPLFIRQGRSIKPTEALRSKIPEVLKIKDAMQLLLKKEDIDPGTMTGVFTIATTDYERSVLLFDACRQIQKEAPGLNFHFKWDHFDNSEALRNGQFDLAIAPYFGTAPSDGICDTLLFQDELLCFFDGESTVEPTCLEDYLERDHISVLHSENDRSFIDIALRQRGLSRNVRLIVPSITEVPPLLSGGGYLVTLPGCTKSSIMRGFQCAAPPFELPILRYGMFWHAATDSSPKHRWIRDFLIGMANSVPKTSAGHIAV